MAGSCLPKICYFYPDCQVPRAKFCHFYPDYAGTSQGIFGGPPIKHHKFNKSIRLSKAWRLYTWKDPALETSVQFICIYKLRLNRPGIICEGILVTISVQPTQK